MMSQDYSLELNYKFAKSKERVHNGTMPRSEEQAAGDDSRTRTASVNNHVHIFDTTLRDGEQSPGCSMTVTEKLRMARKLVELGVDTLEAGFPIASQGDFEAVETISREFPEVQVAALARACKLDVERAARALEKARNPRLHTFIATSDIHPKHKLRKTREQVLAQAVAA